MAMRMIVNRVLHPVGHGAFFTEQFYDYHTGENVAEFIEGKENCHLLQQDNAGLSVARKER